MSSLRNAVSRRQHKERSQPKEREKYGLLEKSKDYKLRAADHKSKLKRLKVLKQKAAERNPDEFSFAMMSTKVDSTGQKITDRGNKALSTDVVKLLKTQDAGYIRTMLQIVRKERKRLEEEMLLDNEGARALKDGEDGHIGGRHTVFVGDTDEQKDWIAEEWFGTTEDGLERTWNRPRKPAGKSNVEEEDEEIEEVGADKNRSRKDREAELLKRKEERALSKKRERTQERKSAHLEAVKTRERDLVTAEEELEKQRAKMNGSIGGINKEGTKFKVRQRKR